jgi:hypothetical protein
MESVNVNFPNREKVLVRNRELRLLRRLPGTGDVRLRAGERISADHVLARTDPKNNAVTISVADQLGIAPQDVAKFLMKPVGSRFSAGEAIARNRKGLRTVVVATPQAGTLISIDVNAGTAIIEPGGAGVFRSLVAGDIEFVDGKQSVAIRTVGSRLFGIVGLGGPVSGEIAVVATTMGEELTVAKVTPELKGKIVVGGGWASSAAIKRLAEVGAVGLITGGFVDREVAASLGASAEDRLSPWRLKPSEQAIADETVPAIALMATEGFGQIPINPHAFAFLNEFQGQTGVLFTATRVIGFLSRPQLIFVNEAMLDDDAPAATTTFSPGNLARFIDQNALGQSVEIVHGPNHSRRGDGNMVEMVEVLLPNGQYRTVPLANIELVA